MRSFALVSWKQCNEWFLPFCFCVTIAMQWTGGGVLTFCLCTMMAVLRKTLSLWFFVVILLYHDGLPVVVVVVVGSGEGEHHFISALRQ